jgi:hypothetical protein
MARPLRFLTQSHRPPIAPRTTLHRAPRVPCPARSGYPSTPHTFSTMGDGGAAASVHGVAVTAAGSLGTSVRPSWPDLGRRLARAWAILSASRVNPPPAKRAGGRCQRARAPLRVSRASHAQRRLETRRDEGCIANSDVERGPHDLLCKPRGVLFCRPVPPKKNRSAGVKQYMNYFD